MQGEGLRRRPALGAMLDTDLALIDVAGRPVMQVREVQQVLPGGQARIARWELKRDTDPVVELLAPRPPIASEQPDRPGPALHEPQQRPRTGMAIIMAGTVTTWRPMTCVSVGPHGAVSPDQRGAVARTRPEDNDPAELRLASRDSGLTDAEPRMVMGGLPMPSRAA
jgi:hypothetical protein